MVLPRAVAARILRVKPLDLGKHLHWQLLVDIVFDDLADAAVALGLARPELPAVYFVDLTKELVREFRHPRAELSLDVRFKNFLKLLPGSYFLITGGLVNERDNADAGQAPDQRLCCPESILLAFEQNFFFLCVEIHFADHWQDLCPVAERSRGSTGMAIPDRLVHINQLARNKRAQVGSAKERRTLLGHVAPPHRGRAAECLKHGALIQDPRLVVEHGALKVQITDDQFAFVRCVEHRVAPASFGSFARCRRAFLGTEPRGARPAALAAAEFPERCR